MLIVAKASRPTKIGCLFIHIAKVEVHTYFASLEKYQSITNTVDSVVSHGLGSRVSYGASRFALKK